jgi:hypothetical protein
MFQLGTLLVFLKCVVFYPMKGIELATEVAFFFHSFAFEHVFSQFFFRVNEMGSLKYAYEFLVVPTHLFTNQ